VNDLIPLAEIIAARLKARRESIAIAESSTGGLIAATLLALPGASAYFLGGAVAYTRQAKILLLGLEPHSRNFGRRPNRTRSCLRAAPRHASVHPGVWAKPARPDRPATATAIRPDTPVLQLPAPSNGR
jgi:hypothetical protein